MENSVPGYAGKFLRVDLTRERITDESFDEATLRKWVGGSGIGAKILYDEVLPGVDWYAPENRIIIASGPLGATTIAGSGSYSLVTKGPLTNGATTSQANGFFGAFLRLNGYDGIILQGAGRSWKWLHLHDGRAELKDAAPYIGLDTWEMHDAIALSVGRTGQQVSVIGIGPAGEHLVKFAAVVGDRGHVAGHNGTGAVMGAKKLKLIAAERGTKKVTLADAPKLREIRKSIIEYITNGAGGSTFRWGTSMSYVAHEQGGTLPVKNYQTNRFPPASDFLGSNYRAKWSIKRHPCWACPSHHNHIIEITQDPYKGFVGKEPEYEQWAAAGSVILNPDPASALVLANVIDRLGFEVNECGWVLGLAMECYQRGILKKEDFGGLDMNWGDVGAARDLLRMIAHRQGIGDTLAEGVMRACGRLGRKARDIGVYTLKGNSPRGHDHRAKWAELLDTSISSTGTIENIASTVPDDSGVPAIEPGRFSRAVAARLGASVSSGSSCTLSEENPFDPERVVDWVVRSKGRMVFEDSLGTCMFCTRVPLRQLVEAVNAATGWDMTYEEAFDAGRRTVNLLRVFNLLHGVSPELDRPSPRYSSAPVDGPAAGISIAPNLDRMVRDYYERMGWDPYTGKPTPSTLIKYGLEFTITDLYPSSTRTVTLDE